MHCLPNRIWMKANPRLELRYAGLVLVNAWMRTYPPQTTAGGYLDVLVSSAQLLTVYAGSNATRFSQTLQDIPLLFSGALKEVRGWAWRYFWTWSSDTSPATISPQIQRTGIAAGWFEERVLCIVSYRTVNSSIWKLWNQDKLDSCLCGTQDCIRDNYLYRQLRIEGYQVIVCVEVVDNENAVGLIENLGIQYDQWSYSVAPILLFWIQRSFGNNIYYCSARIQRTWSWNWKGRLRLVSTAFQCIDFSLLALAFVLTET